MFRFSVLLNRRFTKWCIAAICFSLFVTCIHWITTEPQKNPTPARKFAFMKNHKCGSSTIENIIFRYAHKHNLNVVLPESGNYLSTTALFNHKTLNNTKWRNLPFDIFSLHNRWNREEVMILLNERVPTFTIVRDPVEVFISMFYYQDKFREFYGVKDIHEMVEKIKTKPSLPVLNKRWLNYIGRNQMAWDMGLSPNIFDDKEAMNREIERLDREFDLVMMAHRMDESLVLLMDLLNWSVKDVIHLDLNRRKPDKSSPLTGGERDVLAGWLAADVQIFEYFSRRFDERVAEINWKHSNFFDWIAQRGFYGQFGYVREHTQLLKNANNELYDLCVLKEVGNEKLSGVFKETNNNIIGYVINEEHDGCALFAMSEPAFLKVFQKQLLSKALQST
ncbi:galactosylceramide sulfotransferase-like [Daphnia carinata]|uniref:galactosylceramide sulfotransferase-like n=1 Tax=Daphnia carinata TaxID=120202 RepID=UPI00257BB9CA|nr:galactosylceramide sulfotransferase-like [Daphnia carinata]